MTIKKQYQEIISFLESNKNKKVASILSELKDMTKSKVRTKTFIKDRDGNIIAIFCYFHKQFELVSKVPYGTKKTSTTGLNTMCKVGVKAWTLQQKLIKQVDGIILEKLVNDEIDEIDKIDEIKENMISVIKEETFEKFKREEEYTEEEKQELRKFEEEN